MKFKSILAIAGVVSLSFISCKKDNGSSSKGFEGTWTFSGIHSETLADNTYTDDGINNETITKSVYDSKNNTGTVKFDNGTATSTGLGYVVDTTFFAYSYEDNVLVDSFSQALAFNAPASSSTSGYKLVGADSISFTSSGVLNGASTSGAASGGHYSITDNKLTITTSVLKDSVAHDGTATLNIHETANVKIYLTK